MEVNKVTFVVSCPIGNPDGISDLRQPAARWLGELISAAGDQFSKDGNTSIGIRINGFGFEFSITEIPEVLKTHRIKITPDLVVGRRE